MAEENKEILLKAYRAICRALEVRLEVLKVQPGEDHIQDTLLSKLSFYRKKISQLEQLISNKSEINHK